MLARWPIKYKLLLGVAILVLIVALLSFSGFRGVYAYRQLARSISQRAAEFPKSGTLIKHADALRFITSQALSYPRLIDDPVYDASIREEFRDNLRQFKEALREYKRLLAENHLLEDDDHHDGRIGDLRNERETVAKIEQTLSRIASLDNDDKEWILRQQPHLQTLVPELKRLHDLTNDLPSYLHTRMKDLQGDVRIEYRTWIVLAWVSSILALVMLALLCAYFHVWVFRPLRVLIRGSRRVAADDFEYRIILDSNDEMAELAHAMNAMTARFREIRDDLNHQVRQRTKEVVRREQLASVGFLAAGVAHEINNPLASIAWAAEALESRLEGTLEDMSAAVSSDQQAQFELFRSYLRRIQEEAFRCKDITERLLDFSRMGNVDRQPTDLCQLVEGVVEMIQHLGKYKDKRIECRCGKPVVAPVHPQEMKQVVLNLLTNALDSVGQGGLVQLEVASCDDRAVLTIRDDGCGMTDEVKEHLYEPFFTRRPDGQGTGLGLSITYRILQDHRGTIDAESDGPGCGSLFRVTLPLVHHEKKLERKYQAA
jgi:two-component system, NtrC family, sensor kinase